MKYIIFFGFFYSDIEWPSVPFGLVNMDFGMSSFDGDHNRDKHDHYSD